MTKEEELREIALREIAEEEIAQEEQSAPEEVGQAEAFGLGVMEGIPFAKDAAAAATAMPVDVSQPFITSGEVAEQAQDTLDEESLSGFTDRFRENKKSWDDAINEAEEQHPVTFTAGDIAGSVGALGAVPGGVAASAGVGALEGLSRSENRSIEDVFAGAAIGIAGHGAGKVLGKSLNFIGKKIGLIADKGVVEATGALNKSKVKRVKKHLLKFYTKKGEGAEESTRRFAKEILDLKTPEGKPLMEVVQSFDETATKAGEIREVLGKEMGKVLKEADQVIEQVDTAPLYTKLQQEVVEPIAKISDENAQALAVKLQQRIDSQFKTPITKTMKEVLDKEGNPVALMEASGGDFKSLKVSDLHQLKLFLAKEARATFDKNSGQLSSEAIEMKKHVGITTDFIDDIIEDSGVESSLANNYKGLKRKWATANLINEMAEDEGASRLNGPMNMIKNAFSVRGIAIGAIQKTLEVPTTVAASSAIALNGVIHSGKVPAALAVGLQKLSNHISKNPDSRHLKRLITASGLSSDAMRTAIAGSIAEINLEQSPVKRNIESAKLKRASIITSLEGTNKEMADKLSEAYDNDDDDTISAMLDAISKDPRTKGLIEPGVGWNGKVYSEEDRASFEEEIRSSNLPVSQEIILLEKLNKQRLIPDIQPVQPFKREWSPRAKNKHDY